MLSNIREDVTRTIARAQFRMQEPELPELPVLPDFITSHIDPLTGRDDTADFDGGDGYITTTLPPLMARRPEGQTDENPYAEMDISRNAPCPCGSGRKYKHCHGALRPADHIPDAWIPLGMRLLIRSEEHMSDLQSLMRK